MHSILRDGDFVLWVEGTGRAPRTGDLLVRFYGAKPVLHRVIPFAATKGDWLPLKDAEPYTGSRYGIVRSVRRGRHVVYELDRNRWRETMVAYFSWAGGEVAGRVGPAAYKPFRAVLRWWLA